MVVQKEEKIIKNSENILKDVKTKTRELIPDYETLLSEYKKLFKRYQKVIKIADAVGSEIIHNNDNLQENLNYTIKIAREKLFHSIAEHRKTKEALQEHVERVKELETEILFLRNQLKWEISTNK